MLKQILVAAVFFLSLCNLSSIVSCYAGVPLSGNYQGKSLFGSNTPVSVGVGAGAWQKPGMVTPPGASKPGFKPNPISSDPIEDNSTPNNSSSVAQTNSSPSSGSGETWSAPLVSLQTKAIYAQQYSQYAARLQAYRLWTGNEFESRNVMSCDDFANCTSDDEFAGAFSDLQYASAVVGKEVTAQMRNVSIAGLYRAAADTTGAISREDIMTAIKLTAHERNLGFTNIDTITTSETLYVDFEDGRNLKVICDKAGNLVNAYVE